MPVRVTIRRAFAATPADSAKAWRLYVWKGGSGVLLMAVWTLDGDTRRHLLPTFMEERIVADDGAGTITYEVSDVGMLRDVVPGSHCAKVAFVQALGAALTCAGTFVLMHLATRPSGLAPPG